jgi:four helix bundle protein
MIQSYKDLIVWKKAMDLVELIYNLTEAFPQQEMFGLTSQLRRSAISIPSNIAEGSHRGTRKDYRQFLIIAYGSGAELETQLEIARRLSYADKAAYSKVEALLAEVLKMLNKMLSILKADT